jgi:hypothetical protein
MGDHRTVGGAAEIRHRKDANAGRGRGGEEAPTGKSAEILAGNLDRHANLLVGRRFPIDLGRFDDGSITANRSGVFSIIMMESEPGFWLFVLMCFLREAVFTALENAMLQSAGDP